jgi:hypothetical protein
MIYRRLVIPGSFKFITVERRGSRLPGLRRMLRLPVRPPSIHLLVEFATGMLVKPKGYQDGLAHCYPHHEFVERVAEMGLLPRQLGQLIFEAEGLERSGSGYRWKHKVVLELSELLESQLRLAEGPQGLELAEPAS